MGKFIRDNQLIKYFDDKELIRSQKKVKKFKDPESKNKPIKKN